MIRAIAIAALCVLSAASAQVSLIILYRDDRFLDSGISVGLFGGEVSELVLTGEHTHAASKVWRDESFNQ